MAVLLARNLNHDEDTKQSARKTTLSLLDELESGLSARQDRVEKVTALLADLRDRAVKMQKALQTERNAWRKWGHKAIKEDPQPEAPLQPDEPRKQVKRRALGMSPLARLKDSHRPE